MFQTRRPSEQRCARETGRKSETDCRIRRADAERQLHAMLHGCPCLPRARAASPIAHPCCPMAEPNCHCPDRHHLDDRLVHSLISLALTSSSSPSRQVSTCRTRINVCACLIDADPCWQHPCSMQACRRRKSGREEIGSADPPRPRLCVSCQLEHFQPLTMAGIDQRWRPVACPGRGQHRVRGWCHWDGRGKAS